MQTINIPLAWLIFGTFAALSIGTIIRMVALRHSTADVIGKRIGSLQVWWILAGLWSLAALTGKPGAAVLFAVASLLAVREYLRLLPAADQPGRIAIGSVMLSGAVHYGLIIVGMTDAAKWFLPVGLLLMLGTARTIEAGGADYIRLTTALYWGAMLLIYCFSHALFLFDMNFADVPAVGVVGWFLFVTLLSEVNDIMQAIVGRKFGRHKIAPQVSPHKTYEGLLGGISATVVASVLLAPLLTTIAVDRGMTGGFLWSAAAGILISLAGFAGDLQMSAIKRDAGVKDGSDLLPGMGGMIDRIDSLTFSAPVFYYFVMCLNS